MIRILSQFLTLVIVLLLAYICVPPAIGVPHIAAIVNDDVVSRHDVENRLNLITGTLNLAHTLEVRQRLLPQIIQMLVDEHLKVQEAVMLHITVSNREVASAITTVIEKQNLPQSSEFSQYASHHPLDYATTIDQIRANVAWYKVVRQAVQKQSKISLSEIDTALQESHGISGRPQNLLAEIVLPLDDPTQEEGIRVLAEWLIGQVHTGTDFKAVARQFSQTASAAAGGDLGWIPQGQLDFTIENVLAKMRPGQLSMPIRTLLGYTIILLRERQTDREDMRFTLSQLFMPLTGPEAMTPQTQSELIESARRASSCAAFDALKTQSPQSGPLGQIRAGDLLPALRAVIRQLALHTASAPVPIEGGIAMLMVCGRSLQSDMPSRESITLQLELDRLHAISAKKLRDLRRAAFIEVRL